MAKDRNQRTLIFKRQVEELVKKNEKTHQRVRKKIRSSQSQKESISGRDQKCTRNCRRDRKMLLDSAARFLMTSEW